MTLCLQCFQKMFTVVHLFHICYVTAYFQNWLNSFVSPLHTIPHIDKVKKLAWIFFFLAILLKKTKQNCNLTTHRLCHKTPKWVESWCTGQMFLWLDWTPPVVKLLGHEDIMSKELSVDLRDRILLRHTSGERYRKISAVFKFPMSTTVSIIRKRKKCGSTPANLI